MLGLTHQPVTGHHHFILPTAALLRCEASAAEGVVALARAIGAKEIHVNRRQGMAQNDGWRVKNRVKCWLK